MEYGEEKKRRKKNGISLGFDLCVCHVQKEKRKFEKLKEIKRIRS